MSEINFFVKLKESAEAFFIKFSAKLNTAFLILSLFSIKLKMFNSFAFSAEINLPVSNNSLAFVSPILRIRKKLTIAGTKPMATSV